MHQYSPSDLLPETQEDAKKTCKLQRKLMTRTQNGACMLLNYAFKFNYAPKLITN